MNKNKLPNYISAFVKLMIISSVLNLISLVMYFLKTGDTAPINFFSVIGLDLLYPSLLTSPFAGLYSIVSVVGLYGFLYFFSSNESRSTR